MQLRNKLFLLLLMNVFWLAGYSQSYSLGNSTRGTEDEAILHMMNKQVGQFFRRFNMEEDQYGKLLKTTDRRYHNTKIRKRLLEQMFDIHNPRTNSSLKNYFIEDVTNSKHPFYLNFLDKNWFAEVSATFTSNGKEEHLILFLTLEESGLGSKWIISNVYSFSLTTSDNPFTYL